jgi:crotonobetainyl-CoA:carnitine CoA-transferase CaiB-like acyl-CoA transferase
VYFVAAIAATILIAALLAAAAARFDERRERRWEHRDEFDRIVTANFVTGRARAAQAALVVCSLACAAYAVYGLM